MIRAQISYLGRHNGETTFKQPDDEVPRTPKPEQQIGKSNM